ncbi:MAG TPA: MarR family transcriptional regulator [Marmoricola sp.]|nr:MarR family transcriptional regulator [Marmoricola sp.]
MATDETRWLSEEEQQSWRAYIMGTTMLMDQLDRELQQAHGISMPEYEILVRLSESPDHSVRMAILADALSYSRSRTTHTVKRLENMGLIRREAIPGDGRGVAAVMTEAGWDLLVAAAPTHVNGVRDHLVEQASAEDFAAIGRVFDRVSDQLLGSNPACAEVDIRNH